MSDNKNEILRERKKAQKAFIELKKMQSGEMQIEKSPEVVITKEDRRNTFWFYHKTHVIIALIAAVVLAVCVAQCATRKNYDAKVVVYTNTYLSDIHLTYLDNYLTPYFEDINNDGEVNVQFIDCSYNIEGSYDLDYVRSMSTKLQALISSEGDALLFITDQTRFEELDKNFNSVEHFFTDSIPLSDTPRQNAISDGLDLPENLILGKRIVGGTMIEDSKNIEKHISQADGVFEKLKDEQK